MAASARNLYRAPLFCHKAALIGNASILVCFMKDEDFYKEQAREARKLADQSRDDNLRRAWLQIADDYERLANAAASMQTRLNLGAKDSSS